VVATSKVNMLPITDFGGGKSLEIVEDQNRSTMWILTA
jgi:hypothetical protein